MMGFSLMRKPVEMELRTVAAKSVPEENPKVLDWRQ